MGGFGEEMVETQGNREAESESREQVYELAPLAYLNFDTKGRILDFNVAASRLLGASRKQDIHRPLADFISPRHHRRLLKHIEESRTSPAPVVTRLLLRAQGSGAEVEMNTRPATETEVYRTVVLPIAGKGPVAWPVDGSKFRALVENSTEVICIGAPDGTIFYTTPSVRRVLGYDPASWLGRNAFEVMHPEQVPAARAALRQLAASPTGTVIRLVTQVRHMDGSWKWVEGVLTNLIGEPAVGGIVCNYRDITESRHAEQERERLLCQLERERSELAVQYAVVRVLATASTLADAAPRLLAAFCDQLGWQAGALWMVSADGRDGTGDGKDGAAHGSGRALSLVHVRQQPDVAPAGLLRQSQPDPIGKGESLAGRIWKEKKPLSQTHLVPDRGAAHHRAAARLGLRSAFAFPILLAGEVHGVVELFAQTSFQPAERLLDIVAAVGIQIGQFMERTHALEQLRQSEEALIQANNALERRVRERTAELHEANRELSAEIVERTRLERKIISISEREQRRIGQDLHDGLCQELAAIALMTRALATRLSRSGNPEIGRINEVAQVLNDSISRCRNIARGLHPVEMDADGLMVALKELAERTDQRIACAFECKEPILMPESDVALNLYRIAQEAVNNALKYSRAKRIIISLDREGAALRLSIGDDGRGIPVRSTGRPRKRGGMGLHIMRYRARTMGATLQVAEHRPHGTEVICLLPR